MEFFLVEFQGFFFGSFGSIGHITFSWFFYTKYATGGSSTYEDFSKETSSRLILQAIDGEDFLAIYIGQTKDSLDIIEAFLKLALVKEHDHI